LPALAEAIARAFWPAPIDKLMYQN
jgi:hypothetical protein